VSYSAVILVGPLTAGQMVTLPHNVVEGVNPVQPHVILPDRATPIAVVSATSTQVTFKNLGDQTEAAYFWATSLFPGQLSGAALNYWRGPAGPSSFVLQVPQWDDLRTPASATQAFGANAPTFGLFRDGGAVGAGSAISLNGTTANGTMADFGDFSASFSFMCWFNTAYVAAGARQIIFKNASWRVSVSSGRIVVTLQGIPAITSSVPYLVGQTNHLVVSVTSGGTVEIYQNGGRPDPVVIAALAADNANDLYVGSTNGGAQNFPGTIDELRIYQAVLSAADVGQLWNGGVGTEDEPTSVPTLLAGYHFNEGAGNTADNYEGTAARDMMLANQTWVVGLIGTPPTRGAFTWLFPPGQLSELFCTVQIPHSYKLRTDLNPHVHWAPMTGNAGNVKWALEYTVARPGAAFPTTASLVVVSAATGAFQHILADFPDIPGTQLTDVSAMLVCRLSRLGADLADTYPDAAAFLEFDLHYILDTLGSRQEFMK
jgi:hypothetical protein